MSTYDVDKNGSLELGEFVTMFASAEAPLADPCTCPLLVTSVLFLEEFKFNSKGVGARDPFLNEILAKVGQGVTTDYSIAIAARMQP